jgi:hypothetical protein
VSSNNKANEHWIRLLVKYKGRCAVCGKEIPQGDYALWSRTSKAIKHTSCVESTSLQQEVKAQAQQQQSMSEKDANNNNNNDSIFSSELECFICGKNAGCSTCSLEVNCNRVDVSQACICESCISVPDVYANYQRAFLMKIAKVKM